MNVLSVLQFRVVSLNFPCLYASLLFIDHWSSFREDQFAQHGPRRSVSAAHHPHPIPASAVAATVESDQPGSGEPFVRSVAESQRDPQVPGMNSWWNQHSIKLNQCIITAPIYTRIARWIFHRRRSLRRWILLQQHLHGTQFELGGSARRSQSGQLQ